MRILQLILLFFLSSSLFIRPMDLLCGVSAMVPTMVSTAIQIFPSIKQDIGKMIGPDRLSWMICNVPGPITQLHITLIQTVFAGIFFMYNEYKRCTNPNTHSRYDVGIASAKYVELATITIINTYASWSNNKLIDKESWVGFGKYLFLTECLPTCWFLYTWYREPFFANQIRR